MRALPWTGTSPTDTPPTSRRAVSATPRRRYPNHPNPNPNPNPNPTPNPNPNPNQALELSGILRNGVVAPEFVAHPDLPSAPLRAFSYTMAGGAASCGARPNAVFKCPDGYAGCYPEKLERQVSTDPNPDPDPNPNSNPDPDPNPNPNSNPNQGGYEDFTCGHNPFSNKIVLLDEVHHLEHLYPQP